MNALAAHEAPTLIGILIDVSKSMRTNWKNTDGHQSAKFEVILDALNNQIWKFSTAKSKQNNTEIFCLGMGFQKTISYAEVKFEDGHEQQQETASIEAIQTNIICDLLALSELIPTKPDLEFVKTKLNTKWNGYAIEILNRIGIESAGNSDVQLEEYICQGIKASAYRALRRSWRYRLFVWLQNSSLRDKRKFVEQWYQKFGRTAEMWERKIEISSTKNSANYLERIRRHTQNHFRSHQSVYEKLITDELQSFASQQIQIVLELRSAGYGLEKAIESFHEELAKEIATSIYQSLNRDVTESISNPLLVEIGGFLKDVWQDLHATLNHSEIRRLTELCVRKYGWEVLEPFVEQTVLDLIEKCFTERAEKMLLYWVNLSSSREVIRPLQRIKGLLPEIVGEETLTEKYLFGTTPIQEALSLASTRLLAERYATYRKMLIIISDGEFPIQHSNQSLQTSVHTFANFLKDSGVTIIGLYVASKNIMDTLTSRSWRRWPTGARTMFEISSAAGDKEVEWLAQFNYQLDLEKRFMLQINESKILSQILGGIIGDPP